MKNILCARSKLRLSSGSDLPSFGALSNETKIIYGAFFMFNVNVVEKPSFYVSSFSLTANGGENTTKKLETLLSCV